MTETAEETLRDTVLRVLTDIAPDIDPADVAPETSLRDDLDLDSMDFLNFVIALNEALGVDIPEADYPSLATLQGCLDYLGARLPEGTA